MLLKKVLHKNWLFHFRSPLHIVLPLIVVVLRRLAYYISENNNLFILFQVKIESLNVTLVTLICK